MEDRKIDFDLVGSDAEKPAAKTRGKRGKGKFAQKDKVSGHLRAGKKGKKGKKSKKSQPGF